MTYCTAFKNKCFGKYSCQKMMVKYYLDHNDLKKTGLNEKDYMGERFLMDSQLKQLRLVDQNSEKALRHI